MSAQKKYLLASDYDGTIRKEVIMQKDLDSIRRFRERGNVFAIVTGRAIDMIYHELNYFQVEYDVLVGNNGGIIVDSKRSVIHRIDIDSHTARNLIHELEENRMFVFGFSDGIRYARKSNEEKSRNGNSRLINNVITKYDDLMYENVFNSIFFRGETLEETRSVMETMIKKYGEWMDFHFNAGTVDVSARYVNKAYGVKQIISKEPYQNVFTFGDNLNDMQMIQQYNGFAIASGEDELKRVASHIFESISDVIAFIDTQKDKV